MENFALNTIENIASLLLTIEKEDISGPILIVVGLNENVIGGWSFLDLLVAGNVFPSRTKARHAIESKSVSIRRHLSDTWQKVEFNDVLSVNFAKIVVKFGKRDFKILNLENLIWKELAKL